MGLTEFQRHINSCKRCHFVGIGGVSMSPLAEILHGMGIIVTGSDISENTAIRNLRALGVNVAIGHNADNIIGADFIIRTAAAREDNAEIEAARRNNIPVFERAQAWGYIMRKYTNAICISGVHGKTTTTSMVSHILLAAETDPTIMLGGTLTVLESGCRVGKGDVIVVESCEYYNSFHNFHPTVAVVLNIDADHLDFFKGLDDIKSSFCYFASLIPSRGHIVCNGDDENTMDALHKIDHELLTFGFGEKACVTGRPIRVRGVNVSISGRMASMDVMYDDELFCKVKLRFPGKHNLENALAATASCIAVGIPAEAIEEGLFAFTGVGRRFEFKGNFNGADVYDDYAHHPNELNALFDAVEKMNVYNRIIVAFQPHTYTRTKALFSEFAEQLKKPDIVFLAEIFAARETNDIGVTSSELADSIPGATCISDFPALTDEIAKIAQEGDIILTVGAGDIFKVGEALVERDT